jgi:hypothetical protein
MNNDGRNTIRLGPLLDEQMQAYLNWLWNSSEHKKRFDREWHIERRKTAEYRSRMCVWQKGYRERKKERERQQRGPDGTGPQPK